jgi:hypothetical protein
MLYPFFNSIEPPGLPLSAEVEFVLRVAFGSIVYPRPETAQSSNALGSEAECLRCAVELRIPEIFAERSTYRATASAGPPEWVADLETIRRNTLARQTKAEALRERLQQVVADFGLDLVLLDGFTDARAKRNESGSPGGFEVFALARRQDVPTFVTALTRAGFSAESQMTDNNATAEETATAQRPELTWVFALPNGATVRVEHQLPYVRMVPGGPFVDLDCVKRCGLLLPVKAGGGDGLWQPADAVRAAHITAQALVEHRFDIEYSFLGALHSASLLGLGNDDALAFDAYMLLQTDIEYEEFQAWRELIRGLEAAHLGELSPRARTLLNHALAAATNPLYGLKLLAQRKAQKWQQEGGTERLATALDAGLRFIRRRP